MSNAPHTDKWIKPYGDTMDDGRVQLSFTLPVPLDDNAKEAAQTFAADSGVKVGALKTATQGLFSISAPLGDYGGENTVMKKVRVVTKVQYLVE